MGEAIYRHPPKKKKKKKKKPQTNFNLFLSTPRLKFLKKKKKNDTKGQGRYLTFLYYD